MRCTMTALHEEFQYFKNNQQDLVEKYYGRYLVIKDQEIHGDYDTELEAYEQAKSKYEPGSFLIQHCLPGDEATSQTFHSRVAFN